MSLLNPASNSGRMSRRKSETVLLETNHSPALPRHQPKPQSTPTMKNKTKPKTTENNFLKVSSSSDRKRRLSVPSLFVDSSSQLKMSNSSSELGSGMTRDY